jgi:hypothetical protein
MPTNSSTSNSKRPNAFLLALLVVCALRALELFALPIESFTFRSWEALVVRRLYFALPGPFYPDRTVDMIEEGDLAPHTPLAVKKHVVFTTDSHGYRKRPANDDRWDAVIVGDSFTAGATLTQDDTLSEMLEKRVHERFYPLAPASIGYFLDAERFKNNQPKLVILELMETFIPSGVPADSAPFAVATTWKQKLLQPLLKPFPRLAVLVDRLDKGIIYANASAMLKRLLKKVPPAGNTPMLFRGDPGVLPEQVDGIARGIEAARAVVERRGMRFLFLPIPDKETIYWDLRPGIPKPDGLARLIARLKKDGLPVVDTLSAFEAARRRAPRDFLYHTDDSHWNPRGVALTADLVARELSLH